MFQSTLPVAGERSTGALYCCALSRLVSIHAPRCRGAKPNLSRHPHTLGKFQSTLPVAGERSGFGLSWCRFAVEFQSTLPVAGERSHLDPGWQPEYREVSIHAPRCRGAKLVSLYPSACSWRFQSTLPVAGERSSPARPSPKASPCFNPRSPLPGSEAERDDLPAALGNRFQSTLPVAGERSAGNHRIARIAANVSIHAPRCRGAKPARRCVESERPEVSIHAPRCRGAKRTQIRPGRRICRSFNPRSPLPGSEAQPSRRAGNPIRLFQSTLPVAGERSSIRTRLFGGCSQVSIHAPRCRGAKHLVRHCPGVISDVSIHAPRCRGAKHCGVGCFQVVTRVSIHAPRCRGAKRACEYGLRYRRRFQSTLPVAGERSNHLPIGIDHS